MHKFKKLTYKGKKIEIDEKIVPLISKLWKLGINTGGCCQADCSFNCEHDGYDKDGYPVYGKRCNTHIWIAFSSIKDMERFYDLIAEYSDDKKSMYQKMCCDKFVGREYLGPSDQWCHAFVICNNGIIKRDITGKKISTNPSNDNRFVVSPQVTFPRKHLLYVEERLQLALKRKKAK